MQGSSKHQISFECTRAYAHVCVTILILIGASASSAFANTQPKELRQALNTLTLPMMNEVQEVYQSRDYNLIWSNGKKYNDRAYKLLNVLQNVRKIGLNPNDYDLEIIEYFLDTQIDDSKLLSKSDITFTHAYVRLAANINHRKYAGTKDLNVSYGLLDNPIFVKDVMNGEKIELVITAPEKPQKIITNPSTVNKNPYSRLLKALEKYRSLNDDYEPILLPKKSLALGDMSPEIIKARKKLYALGDYKNTHFYNETYDESLALAVSDFQIRHGLEADGILGRRTVREINLSSNARAQQLEINLERARQLADLNDDRYILVNVPEYKLYVIENGETIHETRVIVGKRKNKTPVLSSVITEFVLNPYWNVPKSITKNEIIPKVQEDPDYLAKNDMKVISRLDNRNQFLNPNDVDWMNLDVDSVPLRIRQDPGKKNALGRVKFIFPNNYTVYLHDTPSRKLFARNSRALSHGCVRVENPLKLAEVLLRNSVTWTPEEMHKHANRTKTKVIKLDNPIPVHITYMTAWVDDLGVVQFRPDIYKRDSQIASTLYNDSH